MCSPYLSLLLGDHKTRLNYRQIRLKGLARIREHGMSSSTLL